MSRKLIPLILFALLFSACAPATHTDEPTVKDIPTPTETPTLEPLEPDAPTPTETVTPTATPTATPTQFVCARLIYPENGLELPAVGKVAFAWEPVEGADTYLLNFTLPNGEIVTFEKDETTKDRYMEAFGISGEFEWNVAVFDINKNEICTSIPFKFTKPESIQNPKDGNSKVQPPPGGVIGTPGQ